MDDKTTPLDDTAEYKFDESEVTPGDALAYEESDSTPESAAVSEPSRIPFKFKFNLKDIDWKRLKTPGIIVLSILIVYVGFTFYSSRKTRVSEQQKIAGQAKAAFVEPAPQPEPIRVPIDEDFGIRTSEMPQVQNMVQEKVDDITQQVASTQDHIVSLGGAVTQIEQNVSGINQNIEQLTMAMQQVLVEIEKLKEFTKPKPKKKKLIPPVAYNVRAIVPGRVWLQSEKGKSVTLRVGDKLEGYGVVRVISPRQGMVLMSNGSIIQYGVNDF